MASKTNQQEQTSAWIFRRALNDNVRYKNSDEIWKDPKFKKEIIGTKAKPGLYPNVDEEWVDNYFKQQKRFLDEFSDAKFTEFSQKQGFMEYVSKLVNKKFKISKKDSWDPADIWCVQNEKKIIADIDKTIKDGHLNSVDQLNDLLRTLFKERKVVGISLKLVSGQIARYQEVNVKKGILFTSSKSPEFQITAIECDLSLGAGSKPKAKNSTIKIKINYSKESLDYYFIFRKHPANEGPGNLIFSFQGKGESAQVGLVPSNLLANKLKMSGIRFENDHKKYPKTNLDFNSEEKKYISMFNKVKSKIDTSISTEKEFVDNITLLLKNKENYDIGHSKLMQLTFLSDLMALTQQKREQLITDIFYLAEKRGEDFGPFGKIY